VRAAVPLTTVRRSPSMRCRFVQRLVHVMTSFRSSRMNRWCDISTNDESCWSSRPVVDLVITSRPMRGAFGGAAVVIRWFRIPAGNSGRRRASCTSPFCFDLVVVHNALHIVVSNYTGMRENAPPFVCCDESHPSTSCPRCGLSSTNTMSPK
jgi:hypothetical protein